MAALISLQCTPCAKGSPTLNADQIPILLEQIDDWRILTQDSARKIARTYPLPDFKSALDLCNRIATLAEAEDHHPDLLVKWGSLEVVWWTHSIGGLHINDFILAARCDAEFTVFVSSGQSA